eukprot:9467474-Pyramimonas_sp.AAC.3
MVNQEDDIQRTIQRTTLRAELSRTKASVLIRLPCERFLPAKMLTPGCRCRCGLTLQGSVAEMDTRNPVLYMDFPQVKPPNVHPKNTKMFG